MVAAPRTDGKDEALTFDEATTLDLLGGDAVAVAAAVARSLETEAPPAASGSA